MAGASSAARAASAARQAASASGAGRAAVDPQPHAGGHGGERVRLDEDPGGGDEEVGVAAGQLVGGDDQPRGGGERVAALAAPRRARHGRRGPAKVSASRIREASERDAAGGRAEALEVLRLVDVQLEEAAQPRQPGRRPGERRRVGAGGRHRVGERDAVVVGAGQRVGDVEPADERARAERRRVEARALLVGERDHRDGRAARSAAAKPAATPSAPS